MPSITEDMIRIRAKELAEKYEHNANAWGKYISLAREQLERELGGTDLRHL